VPSETGEARFRKELGKWSHEAAVSEEDIIMNIPKQRVDIRIGQLIGRPC
jgi:hypothetical protein